MLLVEAAGLLAWNECSPVTPLSGTCSLFRFSGMPHAAPLVVLPALPSNAYRAVHGLLPLACESIALYRLPSLAKQGKTAGTDLTDLVNASFLTHKREAGLGPATSSPRLTAQVKTMSGLMMPSRF